MKRKTIGITFDVPADVYYGLRKYLNMVTKKLNRLFGAAAINRFIEIGYLNEFGESISLPTIDLSLSPIDFFNTTFNRDLELNLKDLRDVVNKK